MSLWLLKKSEEGFMIAYILLKWSDDKATLYSHNSIII
jgi:hypothetical protein